MVPVEAPMKIAVDARMRTGGQSGGVEFVTKGLIRALAELDSPNEAYMVLVNSGDYSDFASIVGSKMRLVRDPMHWKKRVRAVARRGLNALDPTGGLATRIGRVLVHRAGDANRWIDDEAERAWLDCLGCEVVHFPLQRSIACRTRTIFNPHDLQHLHFPNFFQPHEVWLREAVYRHGCHHAGAVAVSSNWVKRDIASSYGVDAAKIHVIPWGIEAPAPLRSHPIDEDDRELLRRFGLQRPFCLYPAVTWEHKNHLHLLDALKLLDDRYGVAPNLICTGVKTAFWARIRRRVSDLGLGGRVRFLGFLPRNHLEMLYRACCCVVIPSLFEASSAPIREAWRWGAPVVSSNVTSLPEQAGDAAVLFDPTDVSAITEALHAVLTDARLRDALRRKGTIRAADFPWSRTARAYRALYRLTSGRALDDEGRALLGRG